MTQTNFSLGRSVGLSYSLLGLLALLSACTLLPDATSVLSVPAEQEALPTPATSPQPALSPPPAEHQLQGYLQLLDAYQQADSSVRGHLLQQVSHAYTHSPTAANQLRLALLLAQPGEDAEAAVTHLQTLLQAPNETLPTATTALMRLYLEQVQARVQLSQRIRHLEHQIQELTRIETSMEATNQQLRRPEPAPEIRRTP